LADLPQRLLRAGLDVWVAPHLYHVSEDSDVWKELSGLTGAVALLQPFYPRAIEALSQRHGAWHESWLALDLRAWESSEELVRELQSGIRTPDGEGALRELDAPSGVRWYPVVDESRCTHCGSCHQFCLFGVYALDGQSKVRIVHPDQCKPGCPACSRICPQGALMFPLYVRDAAIAGAPGKFPKPDASARKMYYARTGATCPACGLSGKSVAKPGVPLCGECGRARAVDTERDELDALLDGLEQLQEGRH
jgi:NAD-dependent dihydropyrimidine dehydrogenase PreA subunit